MMKEREILQALQTGVIAAIAASTKPDLEFLPLGRIARPSGNYLEFVHLPNNVQGQFWGSEKTYRGAVRLILHWSNDDAGQYPPLDVLASVASYFTKDRTLQNGSVGVKIYEEPDLSSAIPNGAETLFPVTLRYMSFQPTP